jgi:hypothetical protein
MAYFTAKCSYQASHTGPHAVDSSLGEYRYFLVEAAEEEDAREMAIQLARSEAHSYTNMHGVTVQWKFKKLEAIQLLLEEHLRPGMEIFSEFFTPEATEESVHSV